MEGDSIVIERESLMHVSECNVLSSGILELEVVLLKVSMDMKLGIDLPLN